MNIEINQKVSAGYNTIYPATEASMVSYDNTTSGLSATNVKDALLELKTALAGQTIYRQYNTLIAGYTKEQLTRKTETTYVPIRIYTTAKQVICTNPFTGDISNLQDTIDYIVENFIN